MRLAVVSVADCIVSAERTETLVTYALGSCIAIMIHDPGAYVGGLLHFMLPDDRGFPEESRGNIYKFARTGIPELFRAAYRLGAVKGRLTVRVAGGASAVDKGGVFDIGRRNYTMMRRILWQAGVLIHSEDVGGSDSRTVRLEVGSGRVWLKKNGRSEEMPLRRRAFAEAHAR